MVNKSQQRIVSTSLFGRLYQSPRQYPLNLRPDGETITSPDPDYQWLVPGDTGFFHFDFLGDMPSGYLLLKMRLRSDIRLIRPFMIYGDAKGFTPGDCFHPQVNEEGVVDMPFWLPDGVTQIHFRFSKVETCFTIDELSVNRISEYKYHWIGYQDHYRRHNEHRNPPLKTILSFIYREMSGVDQELSDAQREAQGNDEYQQYWLRHYQLDEQLRTTYRAQQAEFNYQPKISIIMPVYNVAECWLSKAIDSVLQQVYEDWELCICDDASTQEHIRILLEHYEAKDDRIKVVFSEQNAHISAASNCALAMASGEFIGFLDHDDELAKDALYHVVKLLNSNTELDFIYSDEDLISEKGVHRSPHFKTDWNPYLLQNINYICHLAIFRASLLKSHGGLRLGVEGAQDYDLVLRFTQDLSDKRIAHIPRVLYHWRAIPGSTAHDVGEKSYASSAGIKALNDLHKGLGSNVKITEGPLPTTYRVEYPLPEEQPSVAIIIPTYNCLGLLKTSVQSICSNTTYDNFHIFIVDNNSDDQRVLAYLDAKTTDDRITVLHYPHEFNFSAINNFAVAQVQDYAYVALVNNDVEVIGPDWLREMMSLAVRSDVGCVGAKLIYAHHGIQHGGVVLGLGPDVVAGHSHKGVHNSSLGYAGRLAFVQEYSAVTAACLLVKRDLYQQVGGLNEKDLKIAYNDIDFCLKVRKAGYRNLWTPYADLYHYESVSRGYEVTQERRQRFEMEKAYMMAQWQEQIVNDPFYNPNLTSDLEDFSLAKESPRFND